MSDGAVIYGLYDKRDGRVRYIDCLCTTKSDDYLLRRILFHPPNAKVKRWVKEAGLHGIGIRVLDRCSPADRFKLMQEYIESFSEDNPGFLG